MIVSQQVIDILKKVDRIEREMQASENGVDVAVLPLVRGTIL